MSKLDDYELRRLGQQLIDFKDDLRDILNNGRVQFSIVTAVPTWRANEGEMAFYNVVSPATDRRIYVRMTSGWSVFSFVGAGGGAPSNPGGQEGSVQFNSAGAVGPIFGGDTGFLYDTTGKNADLSGHLAVGNTANTDSVISLYQGTVSGRSSGQVVLIYEALSGTTLGTRTQNWGIVSKLLIQSAPTGSLQSLQRAGHFELEYPPTYTGGVNTNSNAALAAVVSINAASTFGAISAVRAQVLTGSNFNDSSVISVPTAISAESYWGQTIGGNSVVYTVSVRDGNAGSPDIAGGVGLFVGVHKGADRTTPRFNIWSQKNNQTNFVYAEGLNQFAGPVEISNSKSLADASFGIRNDNSAHEFTGSGNVVLTVGSTLATGSGTAFMGDFLPGVSAPPPDRLATPATVMEVSSSGFSNFLIVSSIVSATQITLAEAPTFSTGAQGVSFKVKFPSILVKNDGPNVDSSTGTYPFVVSQGMGRVGVNDPQPTEALSVIGNLKISGVLTSGNTPAKSTGVFFTTTALGISSNNASDTTLINSVIGTTSLVANTLSDGRTIRLQAWGYYNTPTTAGTAIFRVKLSGATILSTSNQTMVSSASTSGWKAEAVITCQTTGGAGTLFAQGRFDTQASAVANSAWFLVGSSPVTFNTTGGAAVEITFQWGSANAASQLFMSHCIGELLN